MLKVCVLPPIDVSTSLMLFFPQSSFGSFSKAVVTLFGIVTTIQVSIIGNLLIFCAVLVWLSLTQYKPVCPGSNIRTYLLFSGSRGQLSCR